MSIHPRGIVSTSVKAADDPTVVVASAPIHTRNMQYQRYLRAYTDANRHYNVAVRLLTSVLGHYSGMICRVDFTPD